MPIKQVPRVGNKRQELLARKETILKHIKYYEKRIREESEASASNVLFDDSSDSDSDFLPCHLNTGPSIPELKEKEDSLQVCMNATCELACLEVLQSEVNVLTEDPVVKGEPPVSKPGLWREVTAECRVGLVPFSIMFLVHHAAGLFGAKSYRNVQLLPVKKSHETELKKSVLPRVKCPSDAIEVLRSYAQAHRSRRSTLSRLADKYANNLFMEPMAEGGYKLKCANLLELSWVLENNKSPLAPFHHKMIFDLEYMDESYIKIIRQAHIQLSDPTIDTDDRTLLLAQIINTCLEAEVAAQESMESETEIVKKVDKRRITLETEEPVVKKTKSKRNDENIDNDHENVNDDHLNNYGNDKNDKNDDKQIMAPPKSLPKKVKPKGKENTDQNKKAVKRSIEENNSSAKKPKIYKNNTKKSNQSDNESNKVTDDKENSENNAKITQNKDKSAKTQNINGEIVKTQNRTEKEPTKVSDKVKVVKSKSKEAIEITKNNNQNNNDTQKKNNVKDGQEKPKKQNKGAESENVVATDVILPNTKNMQTAQKEIVEPKNDAKKSKSKNETKNVATKTSTQDLNKKVMAKNDLNPSESNNEQDNVIKNNQPESGTVKKIDKTKTDTKTADKNQKVTNVKKSTDKVATKKNQNLPKVVSKDGENITNKEKTHQKTVTKENTVLKQIPNSKNVEVTEKNKNKDLKVPKNVESKKVGDQNIIKSKKVSVSQNKVVETQKVNKDGQKTDVKKSKENEQINTDEISPFVSQKIISSTPKADKNNENLRESNSRNIVEKQAKTSNAAMKNKENIANVAISKNPITKTASDKPKTSIEKSTKTTKTVVKNLSHKNPNMNKNNVPKFTSNIKNVKSTNDGNYLKPGNSSKDSNGSKISKIPKKLGIAEKTRRNSLRISPRRLPTTFKSISDSTVKQKLNHITNIPRLLKKP